MSDRSNIHLISPCSLLLLEDNLKNNHAGDSALPITDTTFREHSMILFSNECNNNNYRSSYTKERGKEQAISSQSRSNELHVDLVDVSGTLQCSSAEPSPTPNSGRKVNESACSLECCVTTLLLLSVTVLLVAMIVVGAIHLNNCRVEPKIPVYLLLGGVIGCLRLLCYLCTISSRRDKTLEPTCCAARILDLIICIYFALWLIFGMLWIYREFIPDNHPDGFRYCHPAVYWFAFGLVTAQFVVMGVVLCVAATYCFIRFCGICFGY